MNIDGTVGNKYQLPTATRPYDFGTDAIERQRVSLGQAMMDADFEYGLQATKWQSFFEIRKTPTYFDIPGTDATVSNVVSDGSYPYSNITVYYNNVYSQPQVTGQPISIFGLRNQVNTADRAEGYFLVTSNNLTANTANYIAKGYVSSSNIQTNLTFSRRGGFYSNGLSNIVFSSLTTDASSNIVVATSNAHGILPGTPITLQTSYLTAAAGGFTANGTFIVSNVTSANTFNVVANTTTFTTSTGATNVNTQLYVDPYGSNQHRPYDGGVLLSTLAPVHGSSVLRQSKKAFRYQSGKGILFSSGTLFCPNIDVASVNVYGISTTLSSSFTTLTNSNLQIAVTSTTGFAVGQIVASYLSMNLGTATISAINSSGLTMNLAYTGTTPTSIPSGTVVTTLPVGSNIQLITDITHGIPTTGATVTLRNFGTSGLNATGYTVTGCIDSRTINVQSQNVLTSTLVAMGDQPRLVVTGWHGASVRAGIFDDANGMLWEYDGQTLSVVRRQSTFQCAGYISVSPQSQVLIGQLSGLTGSITPNASTSVPVGTTSAILPCASHTVLANMYAYITGLGYVWVIGVPDYFQLQIGFLPTTSTSLATIGTSAITFSLPLTRFQDQLKVKDRFTIRGMTHEVTSIQGQGILTFNPPYRGTTVVDPAHAVKACKIKELRVPQSQFNRDPMNGTGASGYKVDLSRMQMIGIQYTWYGAGFVDFMMRGADGNWLYAHRIRNNNVNDEAYMRSGNLPVRYELTVENRSAVTSLSSSILASTSDVLAVSDPTNLFPTSGTLLIDNELVYYANNTGTSFTGLTRAAQLTYVINDVPRTLTGQAATTHNSGTSVNLVSCTATPTLTHWGSSFLTDGQFDVERGYYFNYSNTTITLNAYGGTPGAPAAGSNACAFAIRLAPSVTNGLTGDIGTKELLNRAQLLLQKLEVTSPVNVQTIGYLNPTGVTFNSGVWQPVNNQSNGTQPSFVQYYPGNAISGTPLPGERIFSTIVQANNQNNLDLSSLKEMSNSVIGGNQNFPDGPDSLVIFCQNLATTGGSNVIQVNLFWSEAQA